MCLRNKNWFRPKYLRKKMILWSDGFTTHRLTFVIMIFMQDLSPVWKWTILTNSLHLFSPSVKHYNYAVEDYLGIPERCPTNCNSVPLLDICVSSIRRSGGSFRASA